MSKVLALAALLVAVYGAFSAGRKYETAQLAKPFCLHNEQYGNLKAERVCVTKLTRIGSGEQTVVPVLFDTVLEQEAANQIKCE